MFISFVVTLHVLPMQEGEDDDDEEEDEAPARQVKAAKKTGKAAVSFCLVRLIYAASSMS